MIDGPRGAGDSTRVRTALVTGACSGIGRAIAGALAARGHDLVLVSERAPALASAAEELAGVHRVNAHALVLDLAREGAASDLYRAVAELGVEIDVLVNNAGFFIHGHAVDAVPERANALLQLHVVTPSLLCSRFGNDMRVRGTGHILNVSSISAVRPLPGIGYYASSKNYLRGFSRVLRSELGTQGVSVTCLLPGATDTALYDATALPIGLARRMGVLMSADAVAEAGVRAMLAGEAECIPGILARAMSVAMALAPQRFVDLAHRRTRWFKRG